MFSSDYAKNDLESIMNEVGGQEIQFYLASNENDLIRDDYGSVIKINPNTEITNILSFPIQIRPTNNQKEKAGIIKDCDIIFYLSKKILDDKGISINDFSNTRARIHYLGVEYFVSQVNFASQYGNDFLYLIVGGHKK